MHRYYLFRSNKALDKRYFASALEGYPYEIDWHDSFSGSLYSDEDFSSHLDDILNNVREDLGASLCILSSHNDGKLEYYLLEKCSGLYPNSNLFLSTFILEEMAQGDMSFLPLLKEEFSSIPHDCLLTGEAFLRSGLNASLAASTLYIHRNTFNYRLAQFIDYSGLDIRDYHNALLLEIYLRYRNK